MLIKTLAGTALFALAGGAVGYSQILCADGSCSITGTPYGGAIFGGVLGLAVMSSMGGGMPVAPTGQDEPEAEDEADPGRST